MTLGIFQYLLNYSYIDIFDIGSGRNRCRELFFLFHTCRASHKPGPPSF